MIARRFRFWLLVGLVSPWSSNLIFTNSIAEEKTASVQKVGQASLPPKTEIKHDPDFDKFLQMKLLGVAWQTTDAKLLTDISLQLREAEKVLQKKHPLFTSKQLLDFASKVALESKDPETLKRLKQVAEAIADKPLLETIEQQLALAANARDLREDEMFSAVDLNSGAVPAYGNYVLQIRVAKLAGDKNGLESLRNSLTFPSVLRESHRKRLQGVIDEAKGNVSDSETITESLQALSAASRDGQGSIVLGEMESSPKTYLQLDTIKGTSLVCGGMRYQKVFSGVMVETYGRLGTIVFEPGDVILRVSGISMKNGMGQPYSLPYPPTGDSVDAAINQGYATGDRSVDVLDRNTQRILRVFY